MAKEGKGGGGEGEGGGGQERAEFVPKEVPSAGEYSFSHLKHGEIEFEECAPAIPTKYVVIPDSITNPKVLFDVVFEHWRLAVPNFMVELYENGADHAQPERECEVMAAIMFAAHESSAYLTGGAKRTKGYTLVGAQNLFVARTGHKMPCLCAWNKAWDGFDDLVKAAVPIDKPVSERLVVPCPAEGDDPRDVRLLDASATHLFVMSPQHPLIAHAERFFRPVAPSALVLFGGLEGHLRLDSFIVGHVRLGGVLVVVEGTGGVTGQFASAVRRRMRDTTVKGLAGDDHAHGRRARGSAAAGQGSGEWELPESVPVDSFVLTSLHEGLESTVEKITSKLTTHRGLSTELGSSMTEHKLLQQAWEMYLTYLQFARDQTRQAALLRYVVIALIFASTLLAVLFEELKSSEGDLGFEVAIVVVPLVTSFLLTYNSKFAPQARAHALFSAAESVRNEIFKFRARGGPYTVRRTDDEKSQRAQLAAAYSKLLNASQCDAAVGAGAGASQGAVARKGGAGKDKAQKDKAQKDGGEGEEDDARPKRPRERFADHLERVTVQLAAEIGYAHFGGLRNRPRQLGYVRESLFPGPQKRRAFHRAHSRAAARGGDSLEVDVLTRVSLPLSEYPERRVCHVEDEAQMDDGLSPITPDEYFKFRVVPLLRERNAKLTNLTRSYRVLQLLVYVSTAVAAALPPFGLNHWVPVVVAVISAFQSVIEYHEIPNRIKVLQDELMALRVARVWWTSLGLVQKRLGANRDELVNQVDHAVRRSVVGVRGPKQATEEDEDDAQGDGKAANAKAGKRAQ